MADIEILLKVLKEAQMNWHIHTSLLSSAFYDVNGLVTVHRIEVTHSRETDDNGGIGEESTYFKLEFVIE